MKQSLKFKRTPQVLFFRMVWVLVSTIYLGCLLSSCKKEQSQDLENPISSQKYLVRSYTGWFYSFVYDSQGRVLEKRRNPENDLIDNYLYGDHLLTYRHFNGYDWTESYSELDNQGKILKRYNPYMRDTIFYEYQDGYLIKMTEKTYSDNNTLKWINSTVYYYLNGNKIKKIDIFQSDSISDSTFYYYSYYTDIINTINVGQLDVAINSSRFITQEFHFFGIRNLNPVRSCRIMQGDTISMLNPPEVLFTYELDEQNRIVKCNEGTFELCSFTYY
jgi:hypothetical protein